MPQAATAVQRHRDQHILDSAHAFVSVMRGDIIGPKGLRMLEDYANKVEPHLHKASRQMTDFINDQFKDDPRTKERELTRLADLSRSLASALILLRGGYVPALKIDSTNSVAGAQRRLQALELMGYLRAGCQAMDNFIL